MARMNRWETVAQRLREREVRCNCGGPADGTDHSPDCEWVLAADEESNEIQKDFDRAQHYYFKRGCHLLYRLYPELPVYCVEQAFYPKRGWVDIHIGFDIENLISLQDEGALKVQLSIEGGKRPDLWIHELVGSPSNERMLEDHSHMCVDEFASSIRGALDEIEAAWKSAELFCDDVKVTIDSKPGLSTISADVLELRDRVVDMAQQKLAAAGEVVG